MDLAPLFFSLLFFFAFIIYLFFAIYLLHANSKCGTNRAFLMVSISLCFWSFGFAMANSAPSMEVALIWRRVSAVGWSTAYSLILHFFLLRFTKKFASKHFIYHLLLHLPALVCLYFFSFSTKITTNQYNLIQTTNGWVNISPKNSLDFFFYTYYIGYVFVSLGLLWWMRRKANTKEDRKQATLLFYTMLAVLVLGSFFDVILPALFKPLPQMGPIIITILLAAMYYSMRRYNLLPQEYKNDSDDDLILDVLARNQLYHHIGIAFVVGGLLGFSTYFFPGIISDTTLLRASINGSIVFFALGIITLNLKLLKNEKLKEILIVGIIIGCIPLITMLFAQYNNITIWSFSISLMIVSLVFNTRIQLILITVTTILSQVYLWVCSPKEHLLLSGFDYLLRIGIVGISFLFGSVVNKIYISRLKINIEQADFQKFISEISHDFMNVKRENVDEKVDNLLRRMGEFLDIERAYIISVLPERNKMVYTHEWFLEGLSSMKDERDEIPLDTYPWLIQQLEQGDLVYSSDVSRLPVAATVEKERLVDRNVKSLIVLPIEEEGQLHGFIGFHSCANKVWSEQQRELLKILANVVGDGFTKLKAEREIEYLAYYDELTGLPNRTLFVEKVNKTLAEAKENDSFIAILLMDLDSFKTVNDILGYGGGDLVLQQIAGELHKWVRKTDIIARFGGDEFLIMLDNISDNRSAVQITKKIMEIFDKSFTVYGQEFTIKGSAGVAIYPVDGEDVGTLIKNAEIAMYKAKSKGKNQFAICTPHMKAEVQRNMRLANHLHRALERNELFLHYQPQIDLKTNQVIGVEALLRWNHPDLGLIPPNVFVPLAEKNGLINSIGDWVLRTACEQNQKWQAQGYPPIRMAVNLSVIQFNDPQIADKIANICAETGMDPALLELEITESIAITEPRHTIMRLNDLKNLGASIAIDDFGTEYSSLNRLKSLPVDRIKIDMQFVQSIEQSEKDRAITEVIITLAKSLGLEVLAEGVETITQLEFLVERDCNDAQGYYYYKPMPPNDVEEILQKNQ